MASKVKDLVFSIVKESPKIFNFLTYCPPTSTGLGKSAVKVLTVVECSRQRFAVVAQHENIIIFDIVTAQQLRDKFGVDIPEFHIDYEKAWKDLEEQNNFYADRKTNRERRKLNIKKADLFAWMLQIKESNTTRVIL